MKYLIFKVDEKDIELNNPLEMKVGSSTYYEFNQYQMEDALACIEKAQDIEFVEDTNELYLKLEKLIKD